MAARNPLSPLKPLAEQAPWAANGPVKPAMPLEPPSPAFSDFFSSPVVGQAPATVHPAKGAAGRHASRIPRPTPSPDGPAPTSSGLKHRADIPSRIPRLSLPVAHTSDTGNGDLPDGFLSYINPSFGEEADAPAPLAPAAAPAGPLATPDAMQILQRVAHPWDKKPEPMQGIANAMLRTGPQKLSPEPSRDYCIAAPKPPAMANPAAAAAAARLGSATVEPSLVLRDGSGAVEDTHSGACSIDGPPRPPETCEAAETDTPTAQIARKDSNPLVPSTVCSMAPAPAAPPAQAGERAEPAPSHHAAAPTVLLPAVNSAGHEERAAASPSAGHWAEASPHLLEDPASVLAHGAAPQTLMAMPSPEELQAGAPPSRVVSPVAFNLMSESPGSDPASVDRQQRQEEQEESPGAASIGKPGEQIMAKKTFT